MEPGVIRVALADESPHGEAASPAVPAGRLTVELEYDLDLAPPDVAVLDELIEGRPGVGVFLSRAWLSGFFEEPPDGVAPSLAILRQGRVLRGAVPIAVRHTRAHVEVGLLGGAAGSDRVDLLAARGFEAACSDALLSWIAEAFGRRHVVLKLRDVPADSPLWGAIYRAAPDRTRSLVLHPREVHVHPYLNLAEPWSGVAVPGSHVPALDKHRRWLDRRGRTRIDMLREPDDVLNAFGDLERFLHVRWNGSGQGSALDDPKTVRFHRRALPLLLREGRLRMIRLSADARTVAVFYGLATGRWRGYYLAGYDREWAGRIRLGQITLAAAIEAAAREGATEFDFLKGADPVKYQWPTRERATLDADAYSERTGAQLDRAACAMRDAAAALGKAARHLWIR